MPVGVPAEAERVTSDAKKKAVAALQDLCGPKIRTGTFEGPFVLPTDIGPGDWIELGQLGAYGACLRTAFNGFERILITDVADQPLLTTPGHLDQPALTAA